MPTTRRRLALPAALALLAVAAPAAEAAPRTVPWTFQMLFATPARSQEYTADLPFLIKGTQRIKIGRRTYVGPPDNFSGTEFSTETALAHTASESYGMHALFAERPLTQAERKTFIEAVPLYTDADVLVVAIGHPACAGLTTSQAVAIASGAVTNWRELFPDSPDTPITVRYREDGDGSIQTRFGIQYERVKGVLKSGWAPGATTDSSGGATAAANGSPSVAGFTGYSALPPGARASVCMVPIDGVAPDDATVASRTYPASFRVTYVTTTRKPKLAADRAWRSKMLALMRGPKVKQHLRDQGLLTID